MKNNIKYQDHPKLFYFLILYGERTPYKLKIWSTTINIRMKWNNVDYDKSIQIVYFFWGESIINLYNSVMMVKDIVIGNINCLKWHFITVMLSISKKNKKNKKK